MCKDSSVVDSGTAPGAKKMRFGGKVEELGLQQVIKDGLAINMTWYQITDMCNKHLEDIALEGEFPEQVSHTTLRRWWRLQPQEAQAEVRAMQADILMADAWDWEREAIEERTRLRGYLNRMVVEAGYDPDMPEGELKLQLDEEEGLTWKQKRTLIDAIRELRALQESGEKFIGIGTAIGKRYGSGENQRDDILERVKKVIKEEHKDTEDLVDEESYFDAEFTDSESSGDTSVKRKVERARITDL